MQFPKISVVVPSFNQVGFIEETLKSILAQEYPNLELIVIDGGSTDGSVDVIRRWAHRIDYWVSEPDGGQTRGLIKGFDRSTGEIQCWLNSDDLLEPGALHEVAAYFTRHPDADAVFGDTLWIDAEGRALREQREIPFNRLLWLYTYNYVPGMSMFWRRRAYLRVGGLNPEFDLAMDADLWIRLAESGRIGKVRRRWSRSRFYPEQKNLRLRARSDAEDLLIRQRVWRRDRPALYRCKRLAAQAVRVLWKLATGCYGAGYRRDLARILAPRFD